MGERREVTPVRTHDIRKARRSLERSSLPPLKSRHQLIKASAPAGAMDDNPPHRPGTRVGIGAVRPVAAIVSRIAVAVGRGVAIAIGGISVAVAIGGIAVPVPIVRAIEEAADEEAEEILSPISFQQKCKRTSSGCL